MLTFVRTTVAQPGRLFDVITTGKAVAALAKKVVSQDISVCSNIGGSVAEVSFIWQAPSMEAAEELEAKLLASPDYIALFAKMGTMVVPNTTFDRIYRHI